MKWKLVFISCTQELLSILKLWPSSINVVEKIMKMWLRSFEDESLTKIRETSFQLIADHLQVGPAIEMIISGSSL